MRIRIQPIHPNAVLPAYAHGAAEDAGMDLRAVEDAVLAPGVPRLVSTGLAIALPPGYEAQVRPRSGLALRHSITMPNAPGTIDPGYRGEIRVILLNLGGEPDTVHAARRTDDCGEIRSGGVGSRRAAGVHARKRRVWIVGAVKGMRPQTDGGKLKHALPTCWQAKACPTKAIAIVKRP